MEAEKGGGADWNRRQPATRLPMPDERILDYFHLMQQAGAASRVCFGKNNPEPRWPGPLNL